MPSLAAAEYKAAAANVHVPCSQAMSEDRGRTVAECLDFLSTRTLVCLIACCALVFVAREYTVQYSTAQYSTVQYGPWSASS